MVLRVSLYLTFLSVLLILSCSFYTCAHPPLSTWNYRENKKWKKLRNDAENVWKKASKQKNSTGIRKAHELYYQAYVTSEKNDTESFYDYAYTSAVGCIYHNFPTRTQVRSMLTLELDGLDTPIIPWTKPDPTFFSVLPPWTMEPVPLGVTSISQLVAMAMLDSKSLYHVTRAWASAFQYPGPHPIEIATVPDYSATQITITGEEKSLSSVLTNGTPLPPIRILYFSHHFGDHPVGHHIGSLLRLHHRPTFHVICVFTGNSTSFNITNLDSPILERNAGYCDEWVTNITPEVSNKEAYFMIKKLQPDIIVTLDGYDRGHRMDILSVTPNLAFTINYFGFLSTLGADYVQGIIADETTIPSSKDYEIVYREPFILRHPTSFFVTDYQTMHPEVLTQPVYTYSKDKVFTYCSFSQLFKITPELLHTWLRILERTTQSTFVAASQTRLLLPDHPPVGKDNLLHYIQHFYKPSNPSVTVESLIQRIEFIPILPRNEHIVYKRQRCTLGLDTPYYNGHTSTTDLLYGGVPVLTLILPNSTMAGRAAASLVRATNGPEVFIASSYRDYETTAIRVYNAYQGSIHGSTVSMDSDSMDTIERINVKDDGSTATVTTTDDDTPYLWRPTFDAPLFQREQWVQQYEKMVQETFFTFLKEFKPNNKFFVWKSKSDDEETRTK